MGKKTRQQVKKFQLMLNVPDQRHLSYLSDAHAISCARRTAKGQPIQNFENYLLDCVYGAANSEIKAYTEAQAKAQQAQQAQQLQQAQEKAKEAEIEVTEPTDAADATPGGVDEV